MFKSLAVLAFLAVSSAWAQAQTSCSSTNYIIGPAVGNTCPSGYTLITGNNCCLAQQVVSGSSTCTDKTNANGVNECPGLKSYCNNSQYKALMTAQCPKTCGFCTPSSTCADLVNPNTGRSDCAANAGLCNNSLYKETMKTQCPKTCGYCK
ncbi:unnamed protein product [Caenorhabditis brenneri]